MKKLLVAVALIIVATVSVPTAVQAAQPKPPETRCMENHRTGEYALRIGQWIGPWQYAGFRYTPNLSFWFKDNRGYEIAGGTVGSIMQWYPSTYTHFNWFVMQGKCGKDELQLKYIGGGPRPR